MNRSPARPLVHGLLWLLRGYQVYVSPAFPPVCRFSPSCSSYAIEALQVHGLLHGCWLTLRRLLRCAPWHPGGTDPVPPRRSGSCRSRPTTDRHVSNRHEEPSSC